MWIVYLACGIFVLPFALMALAVVFAVIGAVFKMQPSWPNGPKTVYVTPSVPYNGALTKETKRRQAMGYAS